MQRYIFLGTVPYLCFETSGSLCRLGALAAWRWNEMGSGHGPNAQQCMAALMLMCVVLWVGPAAVLIDARALQTAKNCKW